MPDPGHFLIACGPAREIPSLCLKTGYAQRDADI